MEAVKIDEVVDIVMPDCTKVRLSLVPVCAQGDERGVKGG